MTLRVKQNLKHVLEIMCGTFPRILHVEQIQTWSGSILFDIANLKTRPNEGCNTLAFVKDAETNLNCKVK